LFSFAVVAYETFTFVSPAMNSMKSVSYALIIAVDTAAGCLLTYHYLQRFRKGDAAVDFSFDKKKARATGNDSTRFITCEA
jgi:hypothetical protein